jgi:hypothetical protein
MRFRHLLCACLAGASWFIWFAGEARAVPLSNLFQGATITADDKLFSNFNLIGSTPTNGGVADPAQIDVTALVDDPLNPGIKFTAPVGALGTPFGHTGSSSILFVFQFDVATTNQQPLIKDNSLRLLSWVFDSSQLASIQVSEGVFDAAGLQLGQKNTVAKPGETPGSSPLHSDTATFTPRPFVHVVKTILIQGPGDNDGAFLTMFEQRFSQVPEPGSVMFMLIGGAVLGWACAVRRRSSLI